MFNAYDGAADTSVTLATGSVHQWSSWLAEHGGVPAQAG
jgi:predicted GH43/DUF377 family glycosyl hydrolase